MITPPPRNPTPETTYAAICVTPAVPLPAQCHEQACAACHERDGAQSGRALPHLTFQTNGHTAGKRGQQPQIKIKRHRAEPVLF
jgi:hypothetical protein